MKTKAYIKPTTTVYYVQTEGVLMASGDAPAMYEEPADEKLDVLSRHTSAWDDDSED